MRLEQSFEVPVPVSRAWAVLLDLEQVAPCLPGATLTGFNGTEFTGLVKVKLGPVSLSYKGNGRFVERDEAGRRVAFIASGQDSRGAGGASARVTAVLHDGNGGTTTTVKVVADVDIAGRAAQFGRGLIQDVSAKLIRQFADCLARTITADSGAAAVPAPAAPVPPAPVPSAPAPAFAESFTAAPPVAPPVYVEPAPVAPPPPVYVDSAPVAALPPVYVDPPVAPSPFSAEPAPVTPLPPVHVDPPGPPPNVFIPPPEPAPYTPPPEPEYHPLAMEEPAPQVEVEAVPEVKPASSYEPEPAPAPVVEAPPAPAAAVSAPAPAIAEPAPMTLSRPHVEAEPIDLLAVSGAKRKLLPVVFVAAVVVVAVVVWLIVR